MQVIKTITQLRNQIQALRSENKTLAFVPTMGNLHAGHLRLVTEAKQRADEVVVSIFVNPTQFGPDEDFGSYPRTVQQDKRQLQALQTGWLFLPSATEMYASQANTVITVKRLADAHCGASRPGHFSGVATIVCKLLNIVQPDIALFGEKDFQQLAVVRAMVKDLNMPVKIHGVAIVREADGLAMSSRNSYLSVAQRAVAPRLYQALCNAREVIAAGENDFTALEQQQTGWLDQAGFSTDYFSVCRRSDLQRPTSKDSELVILAAASLGRTRLIDNIQLRRPVSVDSGCG